MRVVLTRGVDFDATDSSVLMDIRGKEMDKSKWEGNWDFAGLRLSDVSVSSRCKRTTPCLDTDSACLKQPLTISRNYLSFTSNLRIGSVGFIDLFTMRGKCKLRLLGKRFENDFI